MKTVAAGHFRESPKFELLRVILRGPGSREMATRGHGVGDGGRVGGAKRTVRSNRIKFSSNGKLHHLCPSALSCNGINSLIYAGTVQDKCRQELPCLTSRGSYYLPPKIPTKYGTAPKKQGRETKGGYPYLVPRHLTHLLGIKIMSHSAPEDGDFPKRRDLFCTTSPSRISCINASPIH